MGSIQLPSWFSGSRDAARFKTLGSSGWTRRYSKALGGRQKAVEFAAPAGDMRPCTPDNPLLPVCLSQGLASEVSIVYCTSFPKMPFISLNFHINGISLKMLTVYPLLKICSERITQVLF